MSGDLPSRIGFVGLGSQGGPMAHRIVVAGLPLTVWARRPEALAPYVAKGAAAAASLAELGAQCCHVGICVVNDADVVQVCAELVPAMAPGSVIAIHSTVLPETCAALAADCAARGIDLVDAPVSGGAEAAFERARPVFETFGKLIVRLGEVGAGQRAKIVNNALLAANMGLAQAALSAGEAMGIDRAALAELVKASSGRSFGFEVFARLPSPAAFAHGAPLLVKDVGLLEAILPGHEGTALLAATARPFLSAATGG